MARNTDHPRNVDPGDSIHQRLGRLRRRLYRAPDGKALGVFKGIADSLGYSVRATRWVGVAALIMLASVVGAEGLKVTVLVAGFFYLLTAVLMQPPRQDRYTSQPRASADRQVPTLGPSRRYPAAAPGVRPRVDLAQLDRQLDGLDRRIQRMETVVTGRTYDWERRMQG